MFSLLSFSHLLRRLQRHTNIRHLQPAPALGVEPSISEIAGVLRPGSGVVVTTYRCSVPPHSCAAGIS
jgi:hypothetical protein